MICLHKANPLHSATSNAEPRLPLKRGCYSKPASYVCVLGSASRLHSVRGAGKTPLQLARDLSELSLN
jgi:hypothetical protein